MEDCFIFLEKVAKEKMSTVVTYTARRELRQEDLSSRLVWAT